MTYAIEFLCLSVAKLMVLDRMSNFATPQAGGASLRTRWILGSRVVTGVVLAGNAVGLAGMIASAVHFNNAAEHFSSASLYFRANNTANGLASVQSARDDVEYGASVFTVQAFCEVAVLLVIVCAFVAVAVACSNRITSTLLAVRLPYTSLNVFPPRLSVSTTRINPY